MTLANTEQDMSMLESVVVDGDLSKLSSSERLSYYAKVCDSMGLNPLTKPFEYIRLSGRLVLYAGKNCTDQLCNIRNISVELSEGQAIDGIYLIRCIARTNKLSETWGASGQDRMTESTGAVPIEGLKGEAKANAMMKAETKAKRRAVLSLVGLSMLDSTEVETIPDREAVVVDQATGEIMAPPERPKPLPTPECKPIAPYSLRDPAVIKLAERLGSLGMDWERFLADVLGMEWDKYVADGGTPGGAWKLYEGHCSHLYPLHVPADLQDARLAEGGQVTMDGLTAKEETNGS